MSRFISFGDWQAMAKQGLKDSDMSIECEACDGQGEAEQYCDCCGSESERECEDCSGTGLVVHSESGARVHPQLTWKAYITHVTSDIKKACVFARWDFLDVAAEFFKEQRLWANGQR